VRLCAFVVLLQTARAAQTGTGPAPEPQSEHARWYRTGWFSAIQIHAIAEASYSLNPIPEGPKYFAARVHRPGRTPQLSRTMRAPARRTPA